MKNAMKNSSSDKRVKRIVRSMLSRELELKYYEQTSAGTVLNTGGIFPVTQQIVQGDNVNNRSGNKITVRKVDFNLLTIVNDLSTVRGQFVRVIFFTDSMNVGAFPALTDVLAAINPSSQYSVLQTQTKRFKIHFDKVFALSINGPSSASFRTSAKLDTQVIYNGATSVASANSRNAMFAITLSDQTANYPSLQYDFVVHYHDA